MKSILLLLGLVSIYTHAYTQTKQKYSYLIVSFGYDYDKQNQKSYLIIKAEPGNPDAQKIYKLILYKLDKKTINPGGIFFAKRSDSDTAIYNYFQNATEALLFLSNDGWELVSVISQVISDYKTESRAGRD